MHTESSIPSFEKVFILLVGLDATLYCYSLERPQSPRWCIPVPLNPERRGGLTSLGTSTASLAQCVCSASSGGAKPQTIDADTTAPSQKAGRQDAQGTEDYLLPGCSEMPSLKKEDLYPSAHTGLLDTASASAACEAVSEVDWVQRVQHPSNWLAVLTPCRTRSPSSLHPFGEAMGTSHPDQTATRHAQERRSALWFWCHPLQGWIPHETAQKSWNSLGRQRAEGPQPFHRIVSLRKTEETYLEVDVWSGTWHIASLEDDASEGVEDTWHAAPSTLSPSFKDSTTRAGVAPQRRALLGIHVLSSLVQVSWYEKFTINKRRSIRHQIQLIDHTLELGMPSKEEICNDTNNNASNIFGRQISTSALLIKGVKDESSLRSDKSLFAEPKAHMRYLRSSSLPQLMALPVVVIFKREGSQQSNAEEETPNIHITWLPDTGDVPIMSEHSVSLGQTTGLAITGAFMLDFRFCDEGQLTQLSVVQKIEDATQTNTSTPLSDNILVPYSSDLPSQPHVIILTPKHFESQQRIRFKAPSNSIVSLGSTGLAEDRNQGQRLITYVSTHPDSDHKDSRSAHKLSHFKAINFVGRSLSHEPLTHIIEGALHQEQPDVETISSFFDENFEPLHLLGSGGFGAVLLVRHRMTRVLYAIKILVVRDYASEKDVLQEVRVHSTLSDPHLVRYYACWSELITPKRAQQLLRIGLCRPREAGILRPPRAGTAVKGVSGWGPEMGSPGTGPSPAHPRATGGPVSGGAPPRVPSWRWGNLRLQPGGDQHTSRTLDYPGRIESESEEESSSSSSFSSSSTGVSDLTEGDQSPSRSSSLISTSFSEAHIPSPVHPQVLKHTGDFYRNSERGRTIIGSRVVFLQMEFCQTTLANYLSQRQSVDRLGNLVIALKLISGLRYLHRRGILHRDIKPSNVLLDFRCQHANLDVGSDSSLEAESESDGIEEISPEADVCNLRRRNSEWRGVVDTANPTPGALVPVRQRAGLNYLLYPNGLWQGAVPSFRGKHAKMPTMPPFKVPFQNNHPQTSRILSSKTDIVEPSYDDETISLLLNTPHQIAEELIIRNRRHFSSPQCLFSTSASADAPESGAVPAIMDAEVHKTFKWLQRTLVQVRLSDLGLAKLVGHPRFRGVANNHSATKGVNTTGVGSPLYSSPEQIRGGVCTTASDAFSLGILLAEMYILPKTIAERLDVLRNFREGISPGEEMLHAYPELAIVCDLTQNNPDKRISLAKAQNHLRALLYQLIVELYTHHTSFVQKVDAD